MRAFLAVVGREFHRYWRRRSDAVQAPMIFCLIVVLFPLGAVPAPDLLARYAPAVIWAASLIACVFGLESLYRQEVDEGWVDAARLTGWPLGLLLTIKGLVHWLFTGLPVVLLSWPMARALYFPAELIPELMVGLLLGTPVLVLVGGIGAGLTASLSRGGVLNSLLMLPLYVPVLIFGAGAGTAAYDGLPTTGQLYLLASMLIAALLLAPWASSAALKIATDST